MNPKEKYDLYWGLISTGIILGIFGIISMGFIFPYTDSLQKENTQESLLLAFLILSGLWFGGILVCIASVKPLQNILTKKTIRR